MSDGDMKSWTGLYGERDKEVREEGNEYILAIVGDKDELVLLGSKEELEKVHWHEWINVKAESEEKARERYDDAYYQWRAWNEREFPYPPSEVSEEPEHVRKLKES